MTTTLLLDDTTTDTALDLDVRVADLDREGEAFGSHGQYTSPSTYGVQSRCWVCC